MHPVASPCLCVRRHATRVVPTRPDHDLNIPFQITTVPSNPSIHRSTQSIISDNPQPPHAWAQCYLSLGGTYAHTPPSSTSDNNCWQQPAVGARPLAGPLGHHGSPSVLLPRGNWGWEVKCVGID